MADCYAPEADDLHRRWLPREIFADIGISDPAASAVADDADAAPPAVSVEELAAQLVGILGAGTGTAAAKGKSSPKRAPSPPPPPPPPVATAPAPIAPCRRAPVCGLEGSVAQKCGGGNVVAGGAVVAWPATPYQPWQVASTFVNVGGALEYTLLPLAPPCLVVPQRPPGLKPRGGTGVFLPRTPPPARAGRAPNPRAWPGTGRPVPVPVQPPHNKDGEAAAAGKSQQQWRQSGAQKQKATAAAGPDVAVALPNEWAYL